MTENGLQPLTVIGVQRNREAPCLLLRDAGARQLEIPIRLCEEAAIRLALDGKTVGRPQTHDLLLSIAEHLDALPLRVIIDDYSHGIYYARLVLQHQGADITLDCRPSDGVALALRGHFPIFATESLLAGKEYE